MQRRPASEGGPGQRRTTSSRVAPDLQGEVQRQVPEVPFVLSADQARQRAQGRARPPRVRRASTTISDPGGFPVACLTPAAVARGRRGRARTTLPTVTQRRTSARAQEDPGCRARRPMATEARIAGQPGERPRWRWRAARSSSTRAPQREPGRAGVEAGSRPRSACRWRSRCAVAASVDQVVVPAEHGLPDQDGGAAPAPTSWSAAPPSPRPAAIPSAVRVAWRGCAERSSRTGVVCSMLHRRPADHRCRCGCRCLGRARGRLARRGWSWNRSRRRSARPVPSSVEAGGATYLAVSTVADAGDSSTGPRSTASCPEPDRRHHTDCGSVNPPQDCASDLRKHRMFGSSCRAC